MKNIILIIIIGIFLLSTTQAFEFDNIKSVPNNFDYKKDTIEITSSILWIFPLGKIADIKLLENTDQCFINCKTKFSVKLYEDYENPLTREYFKDRKNNDVIVNGEWYYWDDSFYEIDVPDYTEECITAKNSSRVCNYSQTGTHKETKQKGEWALYDEGIFKAGDYIFEYRGKKKSYQSVDFKMVLFGVDLGDEYIWWDTDWKKRKKVEVEERESKDFDNFTALLTIAYDSDMLTDFDDLRFSNEDGTIELNYWIENFTASTTADVWVKIIELTANENTTIYMYYNNFGASNSSNFNTAFLFADDFEDGVFTDKWTDSASSSTISESGGKLTYRSTIAGPTLGTLRTKQNYTDDDGGDWIVEALMQSDSSTAGDYVGMGTADGWGTDRDIGVNDGTTNKLFMYWFTNSPIWRGADSDGGTWTEDSWLNVGNPVTGQRLVQLIKNTTSGENMVGISGGSVAGTRVTSLGNQSMGAVIGARGDATLTVQHIKIKRYANIEPSVVFGAEESSSTELDSPEDNFITNAIDIEFNCSANRITTTITNMSLFLDGIRNATEETIGEGLVAHYKMNDNLASSNVIDSVGSNDGTMFGNLTGSNFTNEFSGVGKINQAIEFDGVDDYVNLSNTDSINNIENGDFTMVAWINNVNGVIDSAYHQPIIIKSTFGSDLTNDWGFDLESGKNLRFHWNTTQHTSTDFQSLNDGIWHNVVVVKEGDNLFFYKDSVRGEDTFTGVDNRSLSNSKDLIIGARIPFESNRKFNGSIDDVRIYNRSLSQEEITTIYNEGLGTENNGNSMILSRTIENINEGNHNWTCEACDNDDDCIFASPNRTFEIDATAPIITINEPISLINFSFIDNFQNLNWSIIESNLDSLWFDYNGTNVTVFGASNLTNFTIESFENRNLTFYVNDTIGNFNSTFVNWEYKIFEINQTFNNETTEGSKETFLATIKINPSFSIDGINFYYNNSESTGQSFILGDNIILRKENFLIPGVQTQTNNSFIWEIVLSDSSKINLTIQNQSVLNLGIDNCTSLTNEILNFTVVDEEKQTILPNATIEIAVNIYSEDRITLILNFSSITENINPIKICLNTNIIGTTIYSLDSTIKYENVNYAREYYNIINSSLTNESETQSIILYDLNISDSTEFQLTFTGSDFLPVENALVNINRQYISENLFKTVELPKTDFNGQTILHLVRNDVIYNIRIIKNGVVLGNFENLIAFCDDFTIGDCNIELNAFDSVESVFDYNEDLGIIFSQPKYNETTRRISFNFATSDGTAKEVSLQVTRNDIFGNRSICNSTLISSGGTLFCDVDPNIEDSNLNIEIFTENILTARGNVQLDTTNYGAGGYFIMFIMAMSFALLFSGSKTGVLISMIITFVASIGLGLSSGNLIGLGASGLWLLIIIIAGIYKLNAGREQ